MGLILGAKSYSTMRYVGRITEWQDERGFGFVTPDGGGRRAFVHIKEFESGSRRPVVGTVISYELLLDDKCRFHAAYPRFVTPMAQTEAVSPRGLPRKGIAALFLIAIATGCLTSQFPASLGLIYAIMSAMAFVMYGRDKSYAVRHQWRTQEGMLHLVGVCGGWPGALFAQEAFRHKTSKVEFQVLFWFTVAMNCAGLVWLVSAGHMAVVDRAMVEAIVSTSLQTDRIADVIQTHHNDEVRIIPYAP